MSADGIYARGIVRGGLTDRWNKQRPAMGVGPGDRILSVNGIEADGALKNWPAILRELRKSSVELLVAPRASLPTQPRGYAAAPGRLDFLLPPDFMRGLAQGTGGACGAAGGCPICFEELADDASTVQLPCRHAFHFDCAERWLTRCPTFRHASCPTCRARLLGDGSGRRNSGHAGAAAPEESSCQYYPCIMFL